jgi:hypothetical protein
MLVITRHNLMFCRQYPTRVISFWDNVSSSLMDGSLIVRGGCDCSHQSGQGLGWCGKVNRGESLLNVVNDDQPKVLRGWGQKARGQVQVLLTHLTQMVYHRRRGET